MSIRFQDIEFGYWPKPGYDVHRFGVYFSIDGLELAIAKKQDILLPNILRQLADEIENNYPKISYPNPAFIIIRGD